MTSIYRDIEYKETKRLISNYKRGYKINCTGKLNGHPHQLFYPFIFWGNSIDIGKLNGHRRM